MPVLKSVDRSATVAFCPVAPLLAAGTVAGAIDMSFSTSSVLEVRACRVCCGCCRVCAITVVGPTPFTNSLSPPHNNTPQIDQHDTRAVVCLALNPGRAPHTLSLFTLRFN